MRMLLVTAAGFAAALALHGPAGAQSKDSPAIARPGCSQPSTTPATPAAAARTEGSGGSPGASGWSGSGQGGAYTGTTPAGPTPSSPSFQPVTARGLDPIKGIGPPPAGNC